MSQSGQYWIKPGISCALPDALVFDVDGVLIDNVAFRDAVIATVEFFTASSGAPRVTPDDVAAFKRAGGLNNDWDLACALTMLVNSRQRAAAEGGREWPSLDALAAESAGRGLAWAREIALPGTEPEYAMVREVFEEFYWGTDLIRERLGRPPAHLTVHRGFVRDEPPLVTPTFLRSLRSLGITRFGVITGRTRTEMQMGLEVLRLEGSFDSVLTAEDATKPDPEALQRAVTELTARRVLYIGDTRDDLELVRNYRHVVGERDCVALSAIVAPPAAWGFWMECGAEILLARTQDLPLVLEAMTSRE